MKDKILTFFFAVLYFRVGLFLVDLVFRNTLSVVTDFLSVICLIIVFFVSVGLAEFTVKKIADKE